MTPQRGLPGQPDLRVVLERPPLSWPQSNVDGNHVVRESTMVLVSWPDSRAPRELTIGRECHVDEAGKDPGLAAVDSPAATTSLRATRTTARDSPTTGRWPYPLRLPGTATELRSPPSPPAYAQPSRGLSFTGWTLVVQRSARC